MTDEALVKWVAFHRSCCDGGCDNSRLALAIEALLQDKRRLDWLEERGTVKLPRETGLHVGPAWGGTLQPASYDLRKAIDVAMTSTSQNGRSQVLPTCGELKP